MTIAVNDVYYLAVIRYTAQKLKFSSVNVTADLVTYDEKILNGKIHFLHSGIGGQAVLFTQTVLDKTFRTKLSFNLS